MVLYTTDGAGGKTSFNLYGLEGNVIASGRYTGSCAGQYLTYNKDLRGSVTSLLKADGSCALAYQYTDFGETTQRGDADVENEICYTGGIYDESTGLYYLNARYYAPQDGRFLSQDTYRGEAGEYATWNLYTYCANNPVGYVDPSGHTGYAIYMPQVVELVEKIGKLLIEVGKVTAAAVAGYIVGKTIISKGKTKRRRTRKLFPVVDYSKIRIPQVTIPEVEVPDINIPNINLPNFEVPKITIPGVPELEIPSIAIPGIKIATPYKEKDKKKKGEKGKTFRGGKKNKRDKWYGYKNKNFQKWWEKEGKNAYGYDIDSREMADQVWKEWIELGKPKVKGV